MRLAATRKNKLSHPGLLANNVLSTCSRPAAVRQSITQNRSAAPRRKRSKKKSPRLGAFWWALQDLNLRPIGYEPTALTN